jgi:ribosomal protein S27E
VDYYVAKRSEGYARADVRFAQWARWIHLITPNQYERAFVKQNRQIQSGQTPDPIHEIMVEENWIGSEQAVGLLEYLSLPRPSENDEEFLDVLRRKCDVDWDKVQKAKKLQRKAVKKCHEVPPICQLLMEKRVITEVQMLSVLKDLSQGETGDLYDARQMAGDRKSTRRFKQFKKFITPSKQTIRYTAIVVTLLLLGIGAWRWQASSGPEITVKCRSCGEMSRIHWSKTFPVRCPQCGEKTAYYTMICDNGHIFTISNPHKRVIRCPKCGTSETHAVGEQKMDELE